MALFSTWSKIIDSVWQSYKKPKYGRSEGLKTFTVHTSLPKVRVWGLRSDSGFGVLGFRVWGSGVGVWGLGVQGTQPPSTLWDDSICCRP